MSNPKTDSAQFARVLLSELDARPPVDLDMVARTLRLSIRGVNATGFLGASFPYEDTAGGIIRINGNILEAGRQRFTLAHEIGHYVLPQDSISPTVCSTREIGLPWTGSNASFEREVNIFAAELLLPNAAVKEILREQPLSFKTAEMLKERFKVSLTAAAFRSVEVTNTQCALVRTVNGVVQNYQGSASWRYQVPTKCPVSKNTLAARILGDPMTSTMRGLVEARIWANEGKNMEPSAQLIEESLYLPRYDTMLSFLTAV